MNKTNKNLNVIMSMDNETFKVNLNNFYQTKTKKSQIIIGGSLRDSNKHILHLKTKDFGNTKKWPTYSISRNGTICQHYDPHYYSDYMGIKEIDKKSISIVLENMGMLFYDSNKECFINWINEECDEKFVFEKLWKNLRYWEQYTKKQLLTLSLLCEFLCKSFDINLDCLGYNVYDENAALFNGIITRSNIDQNYNDVNPSFDFKLFLEYLKIK